MGERQPAHAVAWGPLLAVVLVAAMARALAYTGFFGSDEVTYTESAFKLLDGDWRVDPYVGAHRYGVNLPMALFGALFGRNEFGAAFWSLACSVAEVGLLAWAGMRWFGLRAGVCAGLVLATLPIHVHFAGRLMADAPLALAISASFVFFIEGERRGSAHAFFAAGIAAGLSFWVKQATIFYVLVFLLYPLLFRRVDLRWAWMVLGAALAVAANLALFAALTGDALYILRAVRSRLGSGFLEEGLAAGAMVDASAYYLQYLFVKVYQTGLLGPLAVAGAWLGWRSAEARLPRALVLWWGLGLLAVLSVLPVSFSPLIFVLKQTNYMLMFVAPLCLIAGLALARWPGRAMAAVVVALVVIPGILLALLQQSSVRVFTANSMATLEYAQRHPSAMLYAGTNAYRAATFESLVRTPSVSGRIEPLDQLSAAALGQERVAILDTQTWAWSSREPIRRLQDVPACWERIDTLTSAPGGAGWHVAQGLRALLQPVSPALAARLDALVTPAPAYVYRLGPGCAAPAVANAR